MLEASFQNRKYKMIYVKPHITWQWGRISPSEVLGFSEHVLVWSVINSMGRHGVVTNMASASNSRQTQREKFHQLTHLRRAHHMRNVLNLIRLSENVKMKMNKHTKQFVMDVMVICECKKHKCICHPFFI